MSLVEMAGNLRDEFASRLTAEHPTLLTRYPVGGYIAHLDAYPAVAPYAYKSGDVRELCESIRRAGGAEALGLYHKLLLVTLVLRANDRLRSENLPVDIPQLYRQNFERIVRDIQTDREPVSFYQYPSFCKELALCTLRLIPAGVQKVCLHGLSRKWFLRSRPKECLAAFRLWWGLGGFRPLYEMHTDSRDLQAMRLFTPTGWAEFYRRVAALLERNPSVRGVVAASWFFDPQLDRISPEIAYLREIVVGNGGGILRLGPCNEQRIQDATLLSPTRKRLWLDGKYVPTNYLVAWPRDRLIAWARSAA